MKKMQPSKCTIELISVLFEVVMVKCSFLEYARLKELTSNSMQCRFRAAMKIMTTVPWTRPLRLKAYGKPRTPAPTTEMKRFDAALTDSTF